MLFFKSNVTGKQPDRHSPLFWRSFLQTSIPAFILIIVIFLTLFNFLIPLIRDKYIEQRKVQLKNITDVAMNIIGTQEKLEREHKRSRALAQQTALERIRSIRYGEKDSGYFWVQNEKSIVIAHSVVPDLEGKSFREVDPEYGDALEKVTELTDVVIANKRDDFLVYDWYNASTGSIGKKLSYIKYYDPWRWVVGTGIFIDDINNEISRIIENITVMGIVLVGSLLILSVIYSYFIVRFRISADKVKRALIESESAVRLRDEQLEMVFDASPFAVAIVRQTDGTIVRVNPPFTKLTGYEQDAVIGRTLVETRLLSESDYVMIQRNIAENGKGDMVSSGNISGSLITRAGEVLNVISSAVSVNIGGDQCFAVMLTDITDERRLQEQLHQSQKMDTVGHLAGGIAHDFNNMLTGILGSAEVIKKSAEESGNDEIREYIDIVIDAAGRAAELTSKLLAFSRRGKAISTTIDVHDSIRSAIMLLKRSIDKKIEIVDNLTAERHSIVGDPSLIQNAFLNIALNANDAMPDGGKMVFASAVVHLDDEFIRKYPSVSRGDYIEIQISDTGTGIAKDILPRIFDPFFTTKPVGKGTGLGLSAVYGAVTMHKGTIAVYSEEGVGTVFKIYLPLEDRIAGTADDESREIKYGKGRILVIDDESIIRNAAFGMLSVMGYDVVLAEDGVQGIEIYKKDHDRIDLVLLDMVMPKLNGKETFDGLIRVNPSVKVIFSSGFNPEGTFGDMRDRGAKGFIPKPYRIAELAKVISDVLSEH